MRNDCKGCWGGRLRLRLFTGRGAGQALSGCALAAMFAAVLLPSPARAQLSGSAALVSDYSVRGMTLSRGRPEPQLRLDYDASAGWYAGAFASGVDLPDSGASLQLLGYAGYAHRLPSGLTWEAGLLNASFAGDAEYRYHEFYAGLTREGLSARLYYSPAYYGQGKTVYAELNGAWPLQGRLTLSGHVGLLHPFGDGGDEARHRIDGRLALGMDIGRLNLQVAVVAATPAGHEAARKLAVGATFGF
jgi:uncharacterized protein (TIGR02001 family)